MGERRPDAAVAGNGLLSGPVRAVENGVEQPLIILFAFPGGVHMIADRGERGPDAAFPPELWPPPPTGRRRTSNRITGRLRFRPSRRRPDFCEKPEAQCTILATRSCPALPSFKPGQPLCRNRLPNSLSPRPLRRSLSSSKSAIFASAWRSPERPADGEAALELLPILRMDYRPDGARRRRRRDAQKPLTR